MAPIYILHQRSALRTNRRFRLRRAVGALFAVNVFIAFGTVSLGAADQDLDGAALFEKHCLSCHARPLTSGTFDSLLRDTRTPPLGMPAFDEDKLTDKEVQAIAEHLFPAAPKERGPSPLAAGRAGKTTDAAVTGKGDQKAAPENTANGSSEEPRRTLKERKAWLRGFGTH